MRQPIDTAPKDGKDVWVENAAGAFDIARWSSDAGEWVWKNGRPINITPTHWHPITEDVLIEDKQSSGGLRVGRTSRIATGLIAVALVAAASIVVLDSEQETSETATAGGSIGLNRAAEAASAQQTSFQPEPTAALAQDDAAASPQPPPAAMDAPRPAPDEESAPVDAAVGDAAPAELRQSLQQEREKSAALATELAKSRGDLESTVTLSSKLQKDAVQRWQAAEIAAEELRQSLQQERTRTAALGDELTGTRRQIETRDVQSREAGDAAAREKQAADQQIVELRRLLQQEQEKTAALGQDAGAARQAMTASAEQQRAALEEAQRRAAALASELAGARSEIESEAAKSKKAADEAAQQKQAAEAVITELRQSLRREQDKTAALVKEAETARTPAPNAEQAEQQSLALGEMQARITALTDELAGTRREIEARDIELHKANDAAAQQRQAAEREIAELRLSLQQERANAETMARDLASAPRSSEERTTPERGIESPVVPVTQAPAAAVSAPTTATEQDKAEAARLIARASALLGQGNIGAARTVLERAAANDNARASFMLAQTYDPAVLSAWGTHGTRGEAVKARELYAKAHSGGIREAKDRLDALSR